MPSSASSNTYLSAAAKDNIFLHEMSLSCKRASYSTESLNLCGAETLFILSRSNKSRLALNSLFATSEQSILPKTSFLLSSIVSQTVIALGLRSTMLVESWANKDVFPQFSDAPSNNNFCFSSPSRA